MSRLSQALLLGGVALAAGSAAADSVTFYERDNFGGRNFTANRTVENFARNGFNDRVHSAVVHDGRWEVCVDSDFNGSCSVLGPGAYPNLGAFAGRISSVRPISGPYAGDRPYDGNRPQDRPHGGARATLYEGPNMSGRAFPIRDVVTNLAPTGFNDRASSLRVESGYWIFCSNADFRGDCRTFGPGEYANLPGLNNQISSGRRISDDYPYREQPNWRSGPYSMNSPNRP